MAIKETAAAVGKKALRVGKFVGKSNILTALATYAVSELIARALEDAAGDPEAVVESIKRFGEREAQVKAQFAITQPAEVEQDVSRHMATADPTRKLTRLALEQHGALPITPEDQPVLSFISSKLGIDPELLRMKSNPSRMGDFSTLQQVLPPEMRDGS